MGDVCTLVFDTTPSPFASISPIIANAMVAVDDCYTGSSLLEVVGRLGVVNETQTNVTKMASDKIDTFDFGAVSSFNLGNIVNLSDNPTSQTAVITSLDLTGLRTTELDDIHNTNVPQIFTNFETLYFIMIDLKDNAAITDLNFANTTPQEEAQGFTDYLAELDAIIAVITNILDTAGNLDRIDTASVSIASGINDIKASTVDLKVFKY